MKRGRTLNPVFNYGAFAPGVIEGVIHERQARARFPPVGGVTVTAPATAAGRSYPHRSVRLDRGGVRRAGAGGRARGTGQGRVRGRGRLVSRPGAAVRWSGTGPGPAGGGPRYTDGPSAHSGRSAAPRDRGPGCGPVDGT